MPSHFSRQFLPTLLLIFVGWILDATALRAGEVPLSTQERALYGLMAGDSRQQRPFLELDPVLSRVARQKAADMARRGYYSHTDPDGYGPNWWVTQAGYPLPSNYSQSPSGNNIESLCAGHTSAGAAWNAWVASSAHADHVLARVAFYRDQTSVGIGYAYDPGSTYQHYWVILTAPPGGPGLSISSPAAGAKLTSAAVTATGTTNGNPAAASVQARVENAAGNGAWIAGTGSANWTVTLTGLTPGDNVLRIRSLNGNGGLLAEKVRTVRYAVTAPLVVQVNGSGSVTEGFINTSEREVGRDYTITATAAAGWIFSSWSGSVQSTSRTITFTMAQGFTLTANFVVNPFEQNSGRYWGLFSSSNVRGFLKLKMDRLGNFTGKLRYNGLKVPITGRFDLAGNCTFAVPASNGTTVTGTLRLGTSGQISGTISDGSFSASLSADLEAQMDGAATAHAGRYTVIIPALNDSTPTTPDGDGFAALVIQASGAATLTGVLADGTKFSTGTYVSGSGRLNVYAPLYSGAGLLTGTFEFRATPASDVSGRLFWSKPAGGTIHPGAFSVETIAVGSRYSPPAAGQPILQVPVVQNNTALNVGDGGMAAPVAQPTTLASDNTVATAVQVLQGVSVTVKPNNGKFVGQFVHPVTGAPTKFRGMILQKQNAGFGFFLGANSSGYSAFTPAGGNVAVRQ